MAPRIAFTSLLLPLDGSRLAESVLPAAESIARRFGSRVTLIHVIEDRPPTTVHGERHLTRRDDAERYLATIADRLRSAGIETVTHVHDAPEGDIAKSVVAHSEEFSPDVVVLTSHGQEGFKGLVYGRIAEQVLSRGNCPVLLIPSVESGDAPAFEPRSVLTPIDGVHNCDDGLEAAAQMAARFGAEIHLVLVVPTMSTLSGREHRTGVLLPSTMRAMLELAERNSADYLAAQAERLRAQGLEVTTEVLRGDTVFAVLGEAERMRAGLIVLTGHGRAGLQALLAGSVTHGIAHRAWCPLLLIRSPGEE